MAAARWRGHERLPGHIHAMGFAEETWLMDEIQIASLHIDSAKLDMSKIHSIKYGRVR
jgi:hypothetical protein